MTDGSKNDVFEVIDGEYFIDKTGEIQEERRKEEPIILVEPDTEEQAPFFIDNGGNINQDRRGLKRTRTGAIVIEPSTKDSFIEFR